MEDRQRLTAQLVEIEAELSFTREKARMLRDRRSFIRGAVAMLNDVEKEAAEKAAAEESIARQAQAEKPEAPLA